MQAHWHDLKPAPAPRDREKQITKRSTFFFQLRKILNYNNPQRYGTFCQLEFGRVLNFQYFSRVQFPFHFQFGESFEFTIFLASVALQTFATNAARAHACHQMETNDSLENIDFCGTIILGTSFFTCWTAGKDVRLYLFTFGIISTQIWIQSKQNISFHWIVLLVPSVAFCLIIHKTSKTRFFLSSEYQSARVQQIWHIIFCKYLLRLLLDKEFVCYAARTMPASKGWVHAQVETAGSAQTKQWQVLNAVTSALSSEQFS